MTGLNHARLRFATLLTVMLFCGSCSLIPCHPYRLDPGPGHTNANLAAEDRIPRQGGPPDGMFIGIATSGGGSRAANFGAAVMLKLRELGILDRADALSSVSGGSLPAAYYALEGYEYVSLSRLGSERIQFREEELRDRLLPDFQLRFVTRMVLPWHILRYWFTSFTRTDIMFDVLDSYLFHEATFADLNATGPKLLINTTDRDDLQHFDFQKIEEYPYGLADLPYKRFVFVDDRVPTANLAALPIAIPVTASMAVPGLFQDVTLERPTSPASAASPDPSQPKFLHLTDGMQTDNQGLLSILEMLQQSVKDGTFATTFPRGCVLISIDAAPNYFNWAKDKDETRREYKDYLFDRNLAEAVDYLLLPQREWVLRQVGLTRQDIVNKVTVKRGFRIAPNRADSPTCDFWHIPLRHIPIQDAFGKELVWYPTELDTTKQKQDFLFDAACRAVKRGWDAGARTLLGRPNQSLDCPPPRTP